MTCSHIQQSKRGQLNRFASPRSAFVPLRGERGLFSIPLRCCHPGPFPEAALKYIIHEVAFTWQAVPEGKRDWLSVSRARVDRKRYLHVLSEIYSSVYF